MGQEGSSDELVDRARAGDQDAWRELYEAHAGRLLLWLGSLHHPDASTGPEDIAADTWLTAARKIADFSGDSDAFAGWLFGVARNLTSNSARRATRRRTDPFESGDPLMMGIEEDPAARISGDDAVSRLLSQLPAREAEVVACLDVVGLDTVSTAAALGISPSAVRVAHHRGLNRLRTLMS